MVCRLCGAPHEPLKTSCDYCGTSYADAQLTGQSYISALQSMIHRIDSENNAIVGNADWSDRDDIHEIWARRVASAISMFAMPTDVANLVQFFVFCHGNAQASGDIHGEAIQLAWNGKAKMAFAQLQVFAYDRLELKALVDAYEVLYGANAKVPLTQKEIKSRRESADFRVAMVGSAVLFAIMGICFIVMKIYG